MKKVLFLLYVVLTGFINIYGQWNPNGNNSSLGSLKLGDFSSHDLGNLESFYKTMTQGGGGYFSSASSPVVTIAKLKADLSGRESWVDIAVAGSNGAFSRIAKTKDIVFRGAGGNMVFSNEGGGDYIFGIGAWSNHNEGMRFTRTGRLGIGTTNPQEALHVNGAVRGNIANGALRVQSADGYLDLGAQNANWAHIYTCLLYTSPSPRDA